MNDEIKEILEQLKWYRIIGKKDVYYPECVLPNKKAFILLDYITNLQQELKIMVKDDERSQETIIRLTKENERLKEWKEDLLKENIELENIRKEAMEYIRELQCNAPEEEALNKLLKTIEGEIKESNNV